MLSALSQRLLPILQLTRMALVFTAISNAYCTALLLWKVGNDDSALDPGRMLSITGIAVGLYGFGMSLNDIIDRRRDEQIASHRPIPSGRLDVLTAHGICTFLGLSAVACSLLYSKFSGLWMSSVLVVIAGLLITFYDMAGKYLVAPGLVSLGLIRFLNALAPAPAIVVLWHPMLLLTHVVLLSTVAYVWEQKRPPLTKVHWWIVLGGLSVLDAMVIALVLERHGLGGLHLTRWLLAPALAVAGFLVIAIWTWRLAPTRREAGQRLMLYGLLWLIVYDVSFVLAYVGWVPAALMLMFLPVAYFSVQLMRWWSTVRAISQTPEFKRA